LPVFSTPVLEALTGISNNSNPIQGTSKSSDATLKVISKDAQILKIWGKMINEAVNHYRSIEIEQRVHIKHRTVYYEIGEKMYLEYPSIKLEGQEPHVRCNFSALKILFVISNLIKNKERWIKNTFARQIHRFSFPRIYKFQKKRTLI